MAAFIGVFLDKRFMQNGSKDIFAIYQLFNHNNNTSSSHCTLSSTSTLTSSHCTLSSTSTPSSSHYTLSSTSTPSSSHCTLSTTATLTSSYYTLSTTATPSSSHWTVYTANNLLGKIQTFKYLKGPFDGRVLKNLTCFTLFTVSCSLWILTPRCPAHIDKLYTQIGKVFCLPWRHVGYLPFLILLYYLSMPAHLDFTSIKIAL